MPDVVGPPPLELVEEQLVGSVTHYFPRVQVAAVEVTGDQIRIGDTIRVQGVTSNFTQRVDSMEIDHSAVEAARVGDIVGIQVVERARMKDLVFRIRPHAKP